MTEHVEMTQRACSSKGRIVILGRIVSASRQIFRADFRPQDETFPTVLILNLQKDDGSLYQDCRKAANEDKNAKGAYGKQ